MRFASQRQLPFPQRRIVLRSTSSAPRGRRAEAVHRARPSAALAEAPTDDGKVFAAKRIRHAIETAGSCMLIALFVVLALFG